MVQFSATKCSCIAILWVSLVSFAAITFVLLLSECLLLLLLFISLSTPSGNFWIHHRVWNLPHFEGFVSKFFFFFQNLCCTLVTRHAHWSYTVPLYHHLSVTCRDTSRISDQLFLLLLLLLSLALLLSLGLGLLHKILLNFLEASQKFSFFLQGRAVSPTPNPHPGGPGLCTYIPQRKGGYSF
jgi:hypothetical protein